MSAIYFFKGCPRCHGDLLLTQELDRDTKYFSCMQCGHTIEITQAQLAQLRSSEATASRQTRSSQRAA